MSFISPKQFVRIIGGAIAAPRRTMTDILEGGPGGLNEVLLLLGLQVLALQFPELVRAGWFMAAVDSRGGGSMLIQAVSQPLLMPLLGALAGSVLLGWIAGQGKTNGRALDLASLAVVPYIVLQALGALTWKLLSVVGLSPLQVQAGVAALGIVWFFALLALAIKLVRSPQAGTGGKGEEGGASLAPTVAGFGAMVMLLLILGFNILLLVLAPEALRPIARGSEPPTFDLPSMSGEDVSLSSYKGRAVLISFWASWCSPCMKEMPFLAGLQKELGPKGLQVLAINVEGNSSLVQGVVDRQGDRAGLKDLLVLVDNGQVSSRFGVRTLPHLVLLDRSGLVSHVQVGSGGEAQIRQRVKAALGQ